MYELPVQLGNLPLDRFENQLARVAESLRPRARLTIVSWLKAEQVAALTLGFVLTMFGLVVLSEVVADGSVVVGALADLLPALRTDAHETAADDLDRDIGRRALPAGL